MICFTIILSIFFINIHFSRSLIFQLTPNTKKCLKEEINKDLLVTGEYQFSEAPNQRIDLTVQDSKGQTLLNREDTTKGKFAFNTEDNDVFEICVMSKVSLGYQGVTQEVNLIMKHGVEAKNYENLNKNITCIASIFDQNSSQLAEAAKLKPLELELKRLEDLSASIVQDFAYMKKKEEEMRNTNVCCLLSLATWQVLYLRRYFKAKKLIE